MVLRINILSKVGRYVLGKYQINMVPTFIVFDKFGNELWRISGSVPELQTIISLDT